MTLDGFVSHLSLHFLKSFAGIISVMRTSDVSHCFLFERKQQQNQQTCRPQELKCWFVFPLLNFCDNQCGVLRFSTNLQFISYDFEATLVTVKDLGPWIYWN